ncbi:MAG: chorismate synthase [Hyphomicrobiaceae bacterium]|nr:chorismate synthase [Hyphomicrobiaceae bacterium]
MSHNSFGHLFRITTWGESHGPALGVVVDGCPPGVPLEAAEIQADLDRRKPGGSRFVTQRRESDTVEILSGVFPDRAGRQVTTGTPISLFIRNEDQRSKDYGDIKEKFRPGHADFTYIAKYGIRDYRGGGRSSARETAARVAAGAVARKVLSHLLGNVTIRGALVQMGPHRVDRARWDWRAVSGNPFFCPDPVVAAAWEDYLDAIRKAGSSIGAVVEVVAEGIPAGLGAPIYGKLDSEIAAAMMTINAVKGVEIGAGMASAELTGEENADEIRIGNDGRPLFLSNNAGGILGGISSGQPIVCRFAVKPTSSILTPRRTIDAAGNETEVSTKGRHDPCVGIRAVPVGEAMMAIVLADQLLRHRGQVGNCGSAAPAETESGAKS